MKRSPLLAAVVAVASTGAAMAHDFWIAPSRFRVAKGDSVELPLRVGVGYEGDPVARNERGIEKFVVLGPEGVDPVPGVDGANPAGAFTPTKDGLYVVAYRGKRRLIELDAAKFEAYLKEEGLERVSKLRADLKETDKPGREVYSRCAKALLFVGDGAKDGFDRVAGLRLEIVPETNPYVAATGDDLSFHVLFEEKPLEGALVVARSRIEPKHVVAGRTPADGRVKLKLDRAGEWLVKCTHMVAAPRETGVDWESLWASVTFELGEKTK